MVRVRAVPISINKPMDKRTLSVGEHAQCDDKYHKYDSKFGDGFERHSDKSRIMERS
jgi:hypothetical protein